MLNFLSDELKIRLTRVKGEICELRIRDGCPVKVNVGGKYYYLSDRGVSLSADKAYCCPVGEVARMVTRAAEKSVYAVSEELKEGFLTTKEGVRLGVGGTFVREGDKIVSLRNFTSLCVRIPKTILGCADLVKEVCLKTLCSLLIVSPPGMGKTTFLKDIIRFLASDFNLLIADERGELSCATKEADSYLFSDKKTAFLCGIRAMRPDAIITDELEENDFPAVKKAIVSGVKVIASAHGDTPPPQAELFDYCVLLSENKVGEVTKIFTKKGEMVYG